MKNPQDFRNYIFAKHCKINLEGTNNTLYQMAQTAPIIDKQTVFDESLKLALGIHEDVKNWYDLKVNLGVYERLFQMTMISICSDIEFMLKDLFGEIQPYKKYNFGFYQRFLEAIKTLEDLNFNFIDIKDDLKNINRGFQIRHIAIHNMGFVDENFKLKIDTEYEVEELYLVTSEEYSNISLSYNVFLDSLDKNLSRLY